MHQYEIIHLSCFRSFHVHKSPHVSLDAGLLSSIIIFDLLRPHHHSRLQTTGCIKVSLSWPQWRKKWMKPTARTRTRQSLRARTLQHLKVLSEAVIIIFTVFYTQTARHVLICQSSVAEDSVITFVLQSITVMSVNMFAQWKKKRKLPEHNVLFVLCSLIRRRTFPAHFGTPL